MIIGISIPALIALFGSLWTYEYINDVKDRHGYVQIADDLRENVLEVRRNEKNYLHYKDTDYFNYLIASINALNRSIKIIPPATIDEIGKNDFLLLNETATNYTALTERLHDNFRQEINSIEQVREQGKKLENYATTGKLSAGLSLNFILNLRRLEKNYMLFRDRDSFSKLDRALFQLKDLIPSCYECIPYVEAVRSLFASYEKSDSVIRELQIAGDNLEETTVRIAQRERQHIAWFFTKTQRFMFMALILLCAIGPLLVYKTASYIVAPIIRLTEITKKIAEGDSSLRAPLKEHDETYTLAVSFNTMLDNLQLTHHSLEKSLELLHEQHMEAEKRASLGFLVSGVAHELNNPLNNISLTAETMKEDLNELSTEELKEHIQDIVTQSERAKHIIEELLDFVGTRKSAVMEKLDIINALAESINLVANQLKVSHIQLKKDIHKIPVFIKGNQNKLEEIFVNIMVNAIHAMKESGELTIYAKPDVNEKFIIIEISDTGCGIPEKELKNIFEPFYTTKQHGAGTGLGLAVARSLVEKHFGDISVRSEVGKGTTFTIRFPLYEEENQGPVAVGRG